MKTNTIQRLEKIVAMHNSYNNGYHYEVKVSDWENYGKNRTYLKVVETRDNSKHYVTYDFGYWDNNSDEYVAGKCDALGQFDLSGSYLPEGFDDEETEEVEEETEEDKEMTTYYLVHTNGYNMAVVVDDETLLSVKDKADRAVFYLTENEYFPNPSDEKEVEEFLRVLDEDTDWHSWDTMPEEEFKDMIEAMDPDHAEVIGRYKVYDYDEEVPAEFGMEDGHFKPVPLAEFARTLKNFRNQLDMNMREITDELEIPYRTWQDWEAGKKEPANWTKKLLLEKLERMAADQEERNMLSKKEVYELLAQKAMELGRAGTEQVTVVIDKDKFNRDIEYRPSLYWEVEDDKVYVSDNAEQKIFTADRETGTFIDEVSSIEEGRELIRQYEESDKKDGTYEENFYDVVDESHNSIDK